MSKYLVVVKDIYVSSEVAGKEFIEDTILGKVTYSKIKQNKYGWTHEDGELVIDIYETESEELALIQGAIYYETDVRALKAYKLA